MRTISKILAGAFIATATTFGASALELSDFVLSYRPYGIAATQKALNGEYYYQKSTDGSKIFRIAYKNEANETTIFNSEELKGCKITDWDGYEMSNDETKILLHTDTKMIYRYSYIADYYVYDVKSQRITKLTDEGGEEIATLSPDNQKVAFVKNNNVYIKNLANGSITTVTTDGEKNKIINGVPDWVYQEEFGILNSLKWSPSSNTLAFIRFDESQVPMYSMTMYEGDCHPNKDYSLYPGSYDYKYPVAGEKNSVVSVMAYDLATSRLQKMNLPITDNDYVPHIDYGTQDDRLMVSTLNRTQNDLHIYAVNPATTQATEVYAEQSTSWIDSKSANDVMYYDTFFVMPSEKSGYMHLYQYAYDGKLIKQLTSGNENVTEFYGYDKARKQFFYQRTNGPLNRMVESVDAAGKVAALTDGDGTYSAKFNSNFKYYIRTFSSQRIPNQYAIYNVNGKKVRDLELNREFAEKYTAPTVPQREFITVESDGYKLNGYIIKPVDFDPNKKYPVIMQQYSGPGSQQVLNKWSLDWQEYFATQGFIIACVDGRGTGGREKAFQSVVYQKLGKYESIDQIAAAKYMASLPYVDAKHIGIWGWSYGGYEALMAMSTPGSDYAAGVAIAPVTSWKFYDTIYAERYMRTPQENPDGYRDGAPLENTDKLKGKLLIMWGSADDNVHVINSMQYISKLHGQGNQFDMMIYTNMNHSINGCSVRLPLYQRVLNFFKANLQQK
ncbi:MAG: S9 family peptidase [Sodaliphilus sp.]|nr:S9 family peptidase [Sodaliphilus sp.]